VAKIRQVANDLRTRFEHGDYRVREFPSVATLAKELQVNERTVRKALEELVKQGIIDEMPAAQTEPKRGSSNGTLYIAMLIPSGSANRSDLWYKRIKALCLIRKWYLQPVSFAHCLDPVIPKCLSEFAGVFLLPCQGSSPQENVAAVNRFQVASTRVVAIDQDLSCFGIPSLHVPSSYTVRILLDVLRSSGHRRVACLNVGLPRSAGLAAIKQWAFWKRMHRADGLLMDETVDLNESVIARAYTTIDTRLRRDGLDASGLFCTTGAAALGAVKALNDHGYEAGKDIAIVAADDDTGTAQFSRPTITCLKEPDWDPFLGLCMDWFANRQLGWSGPRLLHPWNVPIYMGESSSMATAGKVARPCG